MKTTRLFFAAVALASAVSCQKEAFVESESTRELEAITIVAGEKTKTSLNGKQIHWTQDDVIAVFDNTNIKHSFTIDECEGSYATFSGSVTDGTTQIYAVYPENLAVSADGGILKVNIPADQTPKVGSFAEEHNISVAKGAKTPGTAAIENITFKNVCGLLKFTVPSYIEDVTSVTLSSNSVIAGEMTVDYNGEAPACAISTDGSKSMTMTGSYAAGSEFIFVLAPVTLDGFTVTVNTAKASWNITRDIQVELQAGKYRNLGTLELEKITATASANHTYSNGVLTGTGVTVNLGIPASVSSYDPLQKVEISVLNSNGTAVRTVSDETGASSIAIAAGIDWPYLPAGNYTVAGTYTLASGGVHEIETGLSVGKPEFTVNASKAYTSYSKYIEGNKDEANKCDALTIYNIQSASANISDAILSNSNYASIKGSFAYTIGSTAVTSATTAVTALGSHSVTAAYTFDGVTKSAVTNCHITGLPYTLNVAANDSVSPWSESGNVKWNSDSAVRLGYNYEDITSWATEEVNLTKTFNLPANVNVSASASIKAVGSKFLWSSYSTTGSVFIGGNTLVSVESGSNSTKEGSASNSFTMSKDNATVVCRNTTSTNKTCTYIKSLSVTYGNK